MICGRYGRPDLRDLVERLDEFAPDAAPRAEHLAAARGEPVEAAAPLAGLFDPAARHPALFFELVREGIERGRLEAQLAAGSRLDDLRQLIPMAIGPVEDRQHQELGAAFLQGLGRDIHWCHIGMKHIYMTETCQKTLVRRLAPKKRGASWAPLSRDVEERGGCYLASRSVGRTAPLRAVRWSWRPATGRPARSWRLSCRVAQRVRRGPPAAGRTRPTHPWPDVRAIEDSLMLP